MTPPALPPDAALFLDFDGSLIQVPPKPDAVVLPDGLQSLLIALYERLGGAVALISGRDVADLRHHLPSFPGAIAGGHGAELALPPAKGEPPRILGRAAVNITGLHQRSFLLAMRDRRLLVEPKRYGVVMHYRAVPELACWVMEAMTELAALYPGMVVQPAKMAVELRPVATGKDCALVQLMQLSDFANRIPIYAGDDAPDEPAMAEAQRRGGFAVKIGEGASVARYRLPDPPALICWLDAALAA